MVGYGERNKEGPLCQGFSVLKPGVGLKMIAGLKNIATGAWPTARNLRF